MLSGRGSLAGVGGGGGGGGGGTGHVSAFERVLGVQFDLIQGVSP